jgi:hypothetical protein
VVRPKLTDRGELLERVTSVGATNETKPVVVEGLSESWTKLQRTAGLAR